jgi:Ca2+/H+ antiporter, TMEM165/GDT1 family
LSEIGDKTQLLAVALAAKFRRPLPILSGILAACLIGHTLAVAIGALLTQLFSPDRLRWIVGLTFLLMAIWTAVVRGDDEIAAHRSRFGIFATTFVAYSLMEIGDKTQIATVMLATKYSSLGLVVAGTTGGMLLADLPAVLLGKAFIGRLPTRLIRGVTSGIFVALAVLIFLKIDVGSRPFSAI